MVVLVKVRDFFYIQQYIIGGGPWYQILMKVFIHILCIFLTFDTQYYDVVILVWMQVV